MASDRSAGTRASVPASLIESTDSLSSREYGCSGRIENRPRRTHLDDISLLHDDDPVGDVVGRGQIVRDVDDRDPELVAQIPQQGDDRHSQRCVDHRHRLVGDEERWVGNERARNGHALKLSAGEFVCIAPGDLLEAEPHFVQRVVHHRLRRGGGPRAEEGARRRVQVAIDPLERIERLERVLEDRLHTPIEVSPGGAASALRVALAVEPDVATRRMLEAQDHAREGRLARTGLADDREDLGGVGRQRKVGVHDGIDMTAREPAARDEALGDVGHLEELAHARDLQLLGPDPGQRAHIDAAPAGGAMIQPDRLEWRYIGRALLDGERATRMKAAARGRFGKVGRPSLERGLRRGITDAWQ